MRISGWSSYVCSSDLLDVVQADFAAVDPRELFTPGATAQGGFDIIFLSQVFEHVRSPDMFLRNAWAALRPGGVIYIDVPNAAGLTAVIRRWNQIVRASCGERGWQSVSIWVVAG